MGKKTTGTRLEREAVKRYLQQYHAAKQKRRILEERRRTLSADMRGPSTPAYSAMPSSRPVHPDGAGAVVFQIAEVEERIEAQRAEMTKAVQNVMDLIDLLPVGSTERTVVEMRHIDCKPWEQIARAVYLSRSAIFNYYNAALDMLARNEQSGKLLGDFKARNRGPGNGTR